MQALAGKDVEVIQSQLSAMDAKHVLHALFSGICRSEENVHWNAVTCMGSAVGRLAQQDMEEARVIMRRLLWSLNDESGGIGWGAPEALAEIMACHEGLAEEYIHMLVSYMREDGDELIQDGNYLEHEILQRGLIWGMARLASTRPQMLLQRDVTKDLLPYLQSSDAMVRGLAAKSLGLLGAEEAVDQLQLLRDDNEVFRFFEAGVMRTLSVKTLALQAMDQITSREACG